MDFGEVHEIRCVARGTLGMEAASSTSQRICNPKLSAIMEHSFFNPSDVTELARECLRRSSHPALRTVSCEFNRGVLRLRGQLSSFYHKQLAQEAVAHLSGVTKVENEVAVAAR
jgi:osmotically-inducible protein OsmY